MLNIFTFLFAITFLMGVLYLRYLFMIYSIPRRIEEARRLFDTDEKKAVAICNSILALDKGNPLANWLMAKFHTKYKRYILALMFLNEIIQYAKFSPEVPEQDVRETVTQLYLYLGNIEKAIAQFNILQGRYHVNTSLIKRMVSILLEMGNTVEARHLVEKALESNPGDGELDYIFATILFKLNDHGKAESRCAAALRKGYVTPDLYFLLGKLQYLGHRYGEAVGNLSRAYDEKMEDEAECTNLLVQSYYNIHNYRAAVDLAEDKVENYPPADPNTAGIRFFLGCSHEKKGEIDAALAHWEKIKPSQNHYDAAKQKIEFFNYIAQKPYERRFITQPVDSFMSVSEKLIDILGYTIRETVRSDDEILEYVCGSSSNLSLFHLFYFIVMRKTEPVGLTDLKDISIRKNVNKCKFAIITALYFREEAKQYAMKKGIQLYDLSIFEKYKLL